jgi:maltose alpha-D-glucosyltransferase/alpha-amylase
MLVLFDGWDSIDPARVSPWRVALAETARHQLESALRAFVATQRWFRAREREGVTARLEVAMPWPRGGESLLALVRVETPSGPPTLWHVPLTVVWDDAGAERTTRLRGGALARARRHARVGFVADALQDGRVAHAVVDAIAQGAPFATDAGRLRFERTSAFHAIAGESPGTLGARLLPSDGGNTSVALGERLMFKAYRRLQPGLNPEVEIGAYLTETAAVRAVPRLAGAVFFDAADGTTYTLGVLQEFVLNQGSGWRFALDYLEHHLERQGSDVGPARPEEHGGFLESVATLGRRTAELHLALARPTGRKDFDPEPATAATLEAWRREAEAALDDVARRLAAAADALPPETARLAGEFAVAAPRIAASLRALANVSVAGVCIARHHGDYDLGQVLLAKDDFMIVDFEGDGDRTIDERRRKDSPLRDVAGMLRSFDRVRHAASGKIESLQPGPRQRELAATWVSAVSIAFVDAYRAVVTGSCVAPDWNVAAQLVDLFTLSRALEDVRRDLDLWPAGVVGPLEAVLRFAVSPRPRAPPAGSYRPA